MHSIRTFVTELVDSIKRQAPQGTRRVFGPAVGTCPKCGSSLHLRDWEGRHYVKCAGAECKVSFDTDPEGQPAEACRFCQGPVRTTRSGSKICVQCDQWQTDKAVDPAVPAPVACERCGRPMRVIASTRKGQWFHRCSDCGTTLEAISGSAPENTSA